MPNLPERTLIFNSSITGAAVKPAFEDWYSVQTQMPGAMPSENISILNGIIAPTVANIIVDTEGGSAGDELTNINTVNMHDGAEIRLKAKDLGRKVIVKHGSGINSIKLLGGKDRELDTVFWLSLKNVNDVWEEFIIAPPRASSTTAGIARQATGAEVASGVTEGDGPAFVGVELSQLLSLSVGNTFEKGWLKQLNPTTLRILPYTHLLYLENGKIRTWTATENTDIVVATALDTGAVTNGKDYFLYICWDGTKSIFKVSLDEVAPLGYTIANSRKIGGFHTLCVNVGNIAGHVLTGYVAGSILPASVWCLNRRPINGIIPKGMVYSQITHTWTDIYLQSGIGTNTKSVFNGVPTVSRTQTNHTEDLFLVGKRPLEDWEFASVMEGSNQRTNIIGSAPKYLTGGAVDTASRRMISNLGIEEGCGLLWQWLGITAGFNQPVAWVEDTAGKGDSYMVNAFIAGGHWGHGVLCGSRCRIANASRLHMYVNVGGRGCCASI